MNILIGLLCVFLGSYVIYLISPAMAPTSIAGLLQWAAFSVAALFVFTGIAFVLKDE